MALSVKVDLAAYPPGTKLGIVGIGVVENGGDAVEVTPEGESVFFAVNGNTIENATAEQEGIDVSGSAEFETPEGWEPPTTETEVQVEEQPTNNEPPPEPTNTETPPSDTGGEV